MCSGASRPSPGDRMALKVGIENDQDQHSGILSSLRSCSVNRTGGDNLHGRSGIGGHGQPDHVGIACRSHSEPFAKNPSARLLLPGGRESDLCGPPEERLLLTHFRMSQTSATWMSAAGIAQPGLTIPLQMQLARSSRLCGNVEFQRLEGNGTRNQRMDLDPAGRRSGGSWDAWNRPHRPLGSCIAPSGSRSVYAISSGCVVQRFRVVPPGARVIAASFRPCCECANPTSDDWK